MLPRKPRVRRLSRSPDCWGSEVEALARQVIEAAVAKVGPVIEHLIKEQQLDADQQLLVGMGGGIGALLPSVAERLGLPFELAKDAEIISSIGAAMAMVREVVERANPDPSSEDIAELRAETLQAIGRLGADPKTVDITVEIDRQTGRIRAIATGAAALRGPDQTQTHRRAVGTAHGCKVAASTGGRGRPDCGNDRRVRIHREIGIGTFVAHRRLAWHDAPATQQRGWSARRRSRDGRTPSGQWTCSDRRMATMRFSGRFCCTGSIWSIFPA